ncbi:MAG: Rieske (2Fe-2S) protein [Planctomycetes bacterium]|nr:Rieske (2Fe-2S) protein [Planctomycetota bacterium]
MATLTKVGTVKDLLPGTAKVVEIDGHEIALYNVDGRYFATSNLCPHQGGPLGEGTLEGNTVVCPWHAWVFDVTDGTSPVNPRVRIPCYPVTVQGEELFIRL